MTSLPKPARIGGGLGSCQPHSRGAGGRPWVEANEAFSTIAIST
jgi:hypothetical protein